MKPLLSFLILMSMIISCNNPPKMQKDIHSSQIKSRIKNEDLKKIIPHLLEIHKLTFVNNPYYERDFSDPAFIKFFITENYVYAHLSWVNCAHTPLYSFIENIDSTNVQFFVEQSSFQPERYFELNNLKTTPNKAPTICEDWYFIAAKFHLSERKLILEKISTFFDNSYENIFFDKSDSAFLQEIENKL